MRDAVGRAQLRLVPAREIGRDQRNRYGHRAVSRPDNESDEHELQTVGPHQKPERIFGQRPPCLILVLPARLVNLPWGPRQPPLSLPLSDPDEIGGHAGHDRGARHKRRARAEAEDHETCGRRRNRNPQRLSPRHETAGETALLVRDNIDRQRIGGDILKHDGRIHRKRDHSQQHRIARRGVQQGTGKQRHDHRDLRADQPRPAPPHREESVTVHQEPVDELEAPRQPDHPDDIANLRPGRAVGSHPTGNGEIEQADGDALRDVKRENGEQTELLAPVHAGLRRHLPCTSQLPKELPDDCGLLVTARTPRRGACPRRSIRGAKPASQN